MKKIYFAFLSLFVAITAFSQSYPYLNASTGNEGEFPTDKDTNIYMFHGSRLVKTDKNFNVLWAKTYTGFSFSSLLLSQTGSIYFIGTGSTNVFGKLSSSGNISWIRNTQTVTVTGGTSSSYQITCHRLFLDRNNDLVITGSMGMNSDGFLIKTDTNGNALKFKAFSGFGMHVNKFSVLDDSLGYYKILGSGYAGMGPQELLVMHTFSDATNQLISVKDIYALGIPFGFNWRLIKSKFSSGFYIQTSSQTSFGQVFCGASKFDMKGKLKWSMGISNFKGSTYAFPGNFTECEKGDLFYSVNNANTSQFHSSAFIQIDSNGVFNGNTLTTMVNNYNLGWSFSNIPFANQRVIHHNNYYFDVTNGYFPSSPLTVQRFNSSLTFSCSATATATLATGNGTYSSFWNSSPSIQPITSFTIPVFNSSATTTTFAVNSNFCLTTGISEEFNENSIQLFPNPASDRLNIQADGIEIEKTELFDVNGKKLSEGRGEAMVDIRNLADGIYFIKIITPKGTIRKKFVRQ